MSRHQLPDLGFSPDALQPQLSAETLELHHGKHHRGYVEKLNALIADTELAESPLEEVVRRATGALYDNAAQHFNHGFYWKSIAPGPAHEPEGGLARRIDETFGSFAAFREAFTKEAGSLFGSGWCWLVRTRDGRLAIQQTSNAGCPLRSGDTPLLTCDVWEHAYYIDYRNDRGSYVDAFWSLVDWRFVAANLHRAEA